MSEHMDFDVQALVAHAVETYCGRVLEDAQSRMAEFSAVYHITEHMTPEQLERWLRRPTASQQTPAQ